MAGNKENKIMPAQIAKPWGPSHVIIHFHKKIGPFSCQWTLTSGHVKQQMLLYNSLQNFMEIIDKKYSVTFKVKEEWESVSKHGACTSGHLISHNFLRICGPGFVWLWGTAANKHTCSTAPHTLGVDTCDIIHTEQRLVIDASIDVIETFTTELLSKQEQKVALEHV